MKMTCEKEQNNRVLGALNICKLPHAPPPLPSYRFLLLSQPPVADKSEASLDVEARGFALRLERVSEHAWTHHLRACREGKFLHLAAARYYAKVSTRGAAAGAVTRSPSESPRIPASTKEHPQNVPILGAGAALDDADPTVSLVIANPLQAQFLNRAHLVDLDDEDAALLKRRWRATRMWAWGYEKQLLWDKEAAAELAAKEAEEAVAAAALALSAEPNTNSAGDFPVQLQQLGRGGEGEVGMGGGSRPVGRSGSLSRTLLSTTPSRVVEKKPGAFAPEGDPSGESSSRMYEPVLGCADRRSRGWTTTKNAPGTRTSGRMRLGSGDLATVNSTLSGAEPSRHRGVGTGAFVVSGGDLTTGEDTVTVSPTLSTTAATTGDWRESQAKRATAAASRRRVEYEEEQAPINWQEDVWKQCRPHRMATYPLVLSAGSLTLKESFSAAIDSKKAEDASAVEGEARAAAEAVLCSPNIFASPGPWDGEFISEEGRWISGRWDALGPHSSRPKLESDVIESISDLDTVQSSRGCVSSSHDSPAPTHCSSSAADASGVGGCGTPDQSELIGGAIGGTSTTDDCFSGGRQRTLTSDFTDAVERSSRSQTAASSGLSGRASYVSNLEAEERAERSATSAAPRSLTRGGEGTSLPPRGGAGGGGRGGGVLSYRGMVDGGSSSKGGDGNEDYQGNGLRQTRCFSLSCWGEEGSGGRVDAGGAFASRRKSSAAGDGMAMGIAPAPSARTPTPEDAGEELMIGDAIETLSRQFVDTYSAFLKERLGFKTMMDDDKEAVRRTAIIPPESGNESTIARALLRLSIELTNTVVIVEVNVKVSGSKVWTKNNYAAPPLPKAHHNLPAREVPSSVRAGMQGKQQRQQHNYHHDSSVVSEALMASIKLWTLAIVEPPNGWGSSTPPGGSCRNGESSGLRSWWADLPTLENFQWNLDPDYNDPLIRGSSMPEGLPRDLCRLINSLRFRSSVEDFTLGQVRNLKIR